jgi:trimethylamine--corrinoid protein Co-methyltransferase
MRFEVLTERDRHRIHEEALRVLEEVGLRVPPSTPLTARLKEVGQEVRDDGRLLLRRDVVERAMKLAPRNVRLGARDAKRTAVLDGSRTFVTTDGCGASTIDLDSGKRRRSVLGDVAASARLADAMDGIDVYWMMVSAQDVPTSQRVAREYLTALQNTTKHVQMIDVARRAEADQLAGMARVLLDAGVIEDSPVSMLISVVSPLRLDPGGTDAALAFAAAGLPVVACSMPISSVTAPATAPGALLLAHAELLGFITILQLLCPGAPVIYCSFPAFADARTGMTNYGDPRRFWAAAAAAQMGRETNLPCFTSGEVSSLLIGPDLISSGGLLETSTLLSYEQIVIDNESLRDMLQEVGAQELNQDSLALDVIRDVGPGGHFLAQRHTANHIRDVTAARFAGSDAVFDRDAVPGVEPSTRERARQEARRILEHHRIPPLPNRVQSSLEHLLVTPAPFASG